MLILGCMSYQSILLLPVAAKLIEKLPLKRLKSMINILLLQFGFYNYYSTVDHVQRVTTRACDIRKGNTLSINLSKYYLATNVQY